MKRVLFVTLFSALFALVLTGCGGSNNPPLQLTGTSATLQAGDLTSDNIVKAELKISAITLTGVSPTANTGNLLAAPAEIEFSHTAGTFEPFGIGKIPAGTYSAINVTISGVELTVVDAGVVSQPATTLTNSNVTITQNITVGSSPMFLNFDLDVVKTFDFTKTPIAVNPTFTVTTATVPANQNGEDNGDGESDDIHGSVKSITAPNFVVTVNGNDITFATNANTVFKDGITQLSDLKAGDIVEVDAVTQSDGSKLATKVEREGSETGEEAEGIISNETGTAPALTLTVAHQVDSKSSTAATFTITTDANTQFSVRADKLSVTGTFDASHIGKGQRVEADSDGASNTTVAARKLKLREQALVGTVSAASGNTFTLTPSPTSAFATLSGVTSVNVTIASGAKIVTQPTNNATVRVRGVVFVSGTTYTMTAVRVDTNQ